MLPAFLRILLGRISMTNRSWQGKRPAIPESSPAQISDRTATSDLKGTRFRMASPRRRSDSESPKNVRIDLTSAMEAHRTLTRRDSTSSSPTTLLPAPRLSPTLTRSFDPHDLDAQERQRAMDVDSAMQLCESRILRHAGLLLTASSLVPKSSG